MPRGRSAAGPRKKKRRRHGLRLRLPTSLQHHEPLRTGCSNGGEEALAEDAYHPEEEAGKDGRRRKVASNKHAFRFNSGSSSANADEDLPADETKTTQEDAGSDDDDKKQIRILRETSGMPREVFYGKKKKRKLQLALQPRDEGGHVTMHNLLYSKDHRSLQQQQNPVIIKGPLAKLEREKLERQLVYQQCKEGLIRWEPTLKRNREPPLLYFDNDADLGINTVRPIASGFEPIRTEFDKRMCLSENLHVSERACYERKMIAQDTRKYGSLLKNSTRDPCTLEDDNTEQDQGFIKVGRCKRAFASACPMKG